MKILNLNLQLIDPETTRGRHKFIHIFESKKKKNIFNTQLSLTPRRETLLHDEKGIIIEVAYYEGLQKQINM